MVLSILAALAIDPGVLALIAVAAALAGVLAMAFVAARQIGGYTGDTLGACEQTAEILVLAACATALHG